MNSSPGQRTPPPRREDVGVMAETIEQRGGELFVAEHLDPLGKRHIGVMMVEGVRGAGPAD